jgi:hypothetical protein
MKNKKKLVLFLAISALIVLGLRAWDDQKLFMEIHGGKGTSNVILIQDRTGSMYTPIFHPDFNVKQAISGVDLTNFNSPDDITKTLWYIRWLYTSSSTIYVNNSTIYAEVHNAAGNTINAAAEGAFIRVGDYTLQYGSDATNRAGQAVGKVTAVSAPFVDAEGIKFTLTLNSTTEPRQGDFAIHSNLYVWAENTTIDTVFNTSTKIIKVGSGGANINEGDYIMEYNTTTPKDITKQAVGRVAHKSGTSSPYSLTLDNVQGTWATNKTGYRIYYRRTSTTNAVCLYGTDINQGLTTPTNYNKVGFGYEDTYLPWIFAKANDEQRRQISMLSTLGHDVDYNAYLRTTPVSPLNAYALNINDSDKSETLLTEWNRVMKTIYPNKIANLKIDEPDLTTTTTTFKYEKHKASFAGYTTPGFKIKIDTETMVVNSNVIDASGAWGTLTVTRGTQATTGTDATTHPAGAAIMIYNNDALGIDEYIPVTSLFSSMQHVTESTGDVNTTWTEFITHDFDQDGTTRANETNRVCYRYKRVFTRIQMAREALCDVVTAKNKLLKTVDLFAGIDASQTTLKYCNYTENFLARVAPFYIKVVDADGTSNPEVMLVTDHDPATGAHILTVTRGQQGTSACAHDSLSAIMTYSGARDLVRFGIFSFSTQTADNPARKLVDLNNFGQKNTDGTYKPAAYVNTAILDVVNGLLASGSTPLARALAYVWNYLKPNPGSGTANYIKTGSGDWKAVDKDTFGAAAKFEDITIDGVTHPHPLGSPMEYWCQENYAVMITDGDSTDESGFTSYPVFSLGSRKTVLCGNISTDFFKFDYNRSTNPTPWGDTVNDGSEYLTDVAYFLAHQDMFPTTRIITGHWNITPEPVTNIRNNYYDSGTPEADAALYDESNTDPYRQWPGNQNVKTYTIGLCLSNTVLPKAAKNGGGASFTVSNYRDLSEAFINIITSVELAQDPMTYTTYAAPKQSITGGNYGYIAHFIPRLRPMWEGHLRRYRLGDDGSFPDNIDNPASTVVIGGANVVSFQWDAGVILNSRATARVVYTSKPSAGSWPRLDFMSSSDITAADLDVTSGQVTQVKNFIQNFNNADGINANSEYNGLYRLGETFHFNPQLVGYPLSWKANFDPSYKSFYDRYSAGGAAPRTEVVYAGANDGKLHCFQASNGNELWSYVPYTQLKRLKNTITLSSTWIGEHTFFVDGKSLVKDIKVAKGDGTFYNDYRDWKTGIFFGMGYGVSVSVSHPPGGRSYCALDITNPADLKILWETDDDAETTADGRMGFTEAKPVVVDMNGGGTLGTFPAVILPGGYNVAEVKATELSVLPWQRREGKALYILNANTGALVKKFIYGASLTETGNATSGYVETNPGFLTAMTAAPAVLDKNNDGLADVIYLAESGDYRTANAYGGGIWKINCYGDPANWVAQKIYQAPDGQTIFISPSLGYDTDYRVWVMFGTGRRPHPVEGIGEGTGFTNLTGQFVAFIDDNSGTTITNADLHLAATSGNTDYTIDNSGTVKKGFYFDFLSAHEIMYEPQPLYINSLVYFMTLTPQEGVGSSGTEGDPCGGNSSVHGIHYIYEFKLTAQGNTFTIGNFLIQSGKILGLGPMGDKFIVYVGAGDAGNFKPNAGVGGTITFTIENKNNTMFWKEDKK